MDLKKEFSKFNIDTFGVCDARLYNEHMGTSYDRCIVALFPYFCGYPEDSNISIYTHGKDYHLVTSAVLNRVAQNLSLSDYKVHSDIGPAIERELCVRSGLAFMGRNGMCINDKYGSWFFIGYIVCTGDFEISSPMPQRECLNCMKCVRSCPAKALEDGFCCDTCLSYITQKKGELTEVEKAYIRENQSVFGCDICQRVCPHNENVRHTEIEEFLSDRITHLSMDDVAPLTNKTFKKRYGDRAFAWRGKGVIERNLRIINGKEDKR